MSEEIKKILEEFENLFEVSEAPEHIIKDFNKIKDYITNLEEALDKEITAKKKAIEELKEKISYLMPYEIYKNEVEQIGNEVINILEGNDNND